MRCLFNGLVEPLTFLCDRLGLKMTLDDFPDVFEIFLEHRNPREIHPEELLKQKLCGGGMECVALKNL